MSTPFLIVGLGNPGKEYEGTRHNVGFDVVDVIAKQQNCEFRAKSRSHADVADCTVADQRIVLAKPTTYMNESGRAVAALVKQFQIPDSRFQILVLHDDLDLPIGTLRLTNSGSSGGQKGVQSIIDTLGTKEFLRLRIGIGPNETPDGVRIPAEDFVLKRFSKSERPTIDAAITRTVEVIETLLRDGLPAAQKFANGAHA
ncbi:MAG: aminoacyl-tRNA hydrolase [bacterium]|nr:aminoacyl-tRNA hydrolase [bacterium]